MEKIYSLIKKARGYVYGTLFAFVVSKFIEIMEDSNVHTIKTSFGVLFDFERISTVMFWIALSVSLIFFAADKIISYKVNKKGLDKQFVDLMRKYTDNVFVNLNEATAGFSWGTSKTLVYCKNMIDGWEPNAIKIENYDSYRYEFSKDYRDDYLDFKSDATMAKIIEDGDNLPRYMVQAFRENYNPNQPKLFLKLKKTEWSQTKFWWSRTKQRDVLKAAISDVFTYKKAEMPNSFCLHLVLSTNDDKVVLARISVNKSNDYPETFGATIGEQIEEKDFLDTDFRQDFITFWARRALKEEFGLGDARWEYFVNKDAIRVLALEMEGDIYNLSLIVNVRIDMPYKTFYEELGYSYAEKEISKIEPLDYKDIPSCLVNMDENKGKYHPSTYLRLLMVYLHKYGQAKTFSDLLAAEKNKKK